MGRQHHFQGLDAILVDNGKEETTGVPVSKVRHPNGPLLHKDDFDDGWFFGVACIGNIIFHKYIPCM